MHSSLPGADLGPLSLREARCHDDCVPRLGGWAILEISDGELARRISAQPNAARSEEAELCRRLAPRIRLYGRRHLGSPEQADELEQRVLVRVIEKLRSGLVREPDRIASFALGTARNATKELLRARAEIAPFDEARSEPVRPVRRDTLALKRLAEALGGLEERERSILVMTFYGERSAPEIGAALGLSPQNVRVIRHRALKSLRVELGEEP